MKEELTVHDMENGRDFWLWAAENPGGYKSEWPGYRSRLSACREACPFCDVYGTKTLYEATDCPDCPLRQVMGVPCGHDASLFQLWVPSNQYPASIQTAAAKEIAAIFQSEIDKLKASEKKRMWEPTSDDIG